MQIQHHAKVLGRISKDNGFNEDHNLIYYDRQKVFCDEGHLLTNLYGRNNNGNFGFGFDCVKFDVEAMECKEYFTNYNEATDKSIVYLDRHDVKCPDDQAMQGFEGQSQNGQLRYAYTCCQLFIKVCGVFSYFFSIT